MTWTESCRVLSTLLERFEDEQSSIPVGRTSTPSGAFRHVLKAEAATAAHMDIMIADLLKGKPTQTNAIQAYFLSQRIKYALVIARAMSTPSRQSKLRPIPARMSRKALLTWLLIDVWYSTTRHLWRITLESLLKTAVLRSHSLEST